MLLLSPKEVGLGFRSVCRAGGIVRLKYSLMGWE